MIFPPSKIRKKKIEHLLPGEDAQFDFYSEWEFNGGMNFRENF